MFSRVLKSTTAQPSPAKDPYTRDGEIPPSPSKRSSHVKSASTTTGAPPTPSKIPVPVTRSGFASPAKENNNPERSNYLSFLFNKDGNSATVNTGSSTPVKVNKQVNQSSNPASVHHNNQYTKSQYEIPPYQHHSQQQASRYDSEDVHMQTMKNTVNPAMLKHMSNIPTPAPAASRPVPPLPPHAPQHLAPSRSANEDIHMRTHRQETRAEKGVLSPEHRALLESQEVRRKATVAQICEFDHLSI